MLIMKQNKKAFDKHNKVTTIFGYSLFILTVLTVIIGTAIPLGLALFHPTARHFNIIVILITFFIAAILPALGSYLLGDRATHNRNKALHHYNGVLFGVAAYWVSLFFTFIGFNQYVHFSELPFPFPIVIANGIPILLSIVVMAIVAVMYARKQKNMTSVLYHRPYQVVLIGSALGFLIYVAFGQNYTMIELLWLSLSSLAIPVILTAISYKLVARFHTTRLARLSDAVIAMSVGGITSSLMNSFVAYLNLPWVGTYVISYAIAIIVWVLYLYLRTRKA